MLPLLNRLGLAVLLFGSFILAPAIALAATDADYIAAFNVQHGKVASPPALEAYATQSWFDSRNMGSQASVFTRIRTEHNDGGYLAWTISYRVHSYVEMYYATGERKYLEMLRDYTRVLLESRDDALGLLIWDVATPTPIWGAGERYTGTADKRAAFPVHTGMLTWPMLEFLQLAQRDAGFMEELGGEYQTMLTKIQQSLDFHDRQWAEGPTAGEGRYLFLHQEPGLDGNTLPVNRLGAMGRALWVAWKLTGRADYRDKALKIGHYIRNRMRIDTADNAYYWAYYLPASPISTPPSKASLNGGEDVSHGSLSMAFPLMLAQEGEIFGMEDGIAFANTVLKGVGRLPERGVLYGNVVGAPVGDLASLTQKVARAGRWFQVAPYSEAAYHEIADYFLQYVESPSDLDLALMIRYMPGRARARNFTVYE